MAELSLQEQIAALRAENEVLKASNPMGKQRVTVKVSGTGTGCICIYGLGRRPVSLYKSQIDVLFNDENVAKVRAFSAAHPELAKKVEAAAATTETK